MTCSVGPVSLALACLLEQPDDPWLVVSEEQTSAQTLDEYGLRFDIEEAFLAEKSGGYQLHASKLATPEALERLLLIVAIATLHLTSIGAGPSPGGQASLGRSPLGSGNELFETWLALAAAAISAWMAGVCSFLA